MKKSGIDVSIIKSYLYIYSFLCGAYTGSRKYKRQFSLIKGVIFHALYNLKLGDNHENISYDKCWSDIYIIIDLGDQCMDILHNNVTHIYSLAMRVGIMDRQKLLIW